jgi:hypothetical protein
VNHWFVWPDGKGFKLVLLKDHRFAGAVDKFGVHGFGGVDEDDASPEEEGEIHGGEVFHERGDLDGFRVEEPFLVKVDGFGAFAHYGGIKFNGFQEVGKFGVSPSFVFKIGQDPGGFQISDIAGRTVKVFGYFRFSQKFFIRGDENRRRIFFEFQRIELAAEFSERRKKGIDCSQEGGFKQVFHNA